MTGLSVKGALGEHGHLYQAILDNQFQNQTLHSDSISSSGREKRATSFITIVTFLRERERVHEIELDNNIIEYCTLICNNAVL